VKIFYDLHIHSALSPCADDDMTPNNIVNMAKLIGLDAIAVTDHNCGDNLLAVEKVARDVGMVFVPGMELSTLEEVHLLAYFPDAEKAAAFGEMIYGALPDIENNEGFFGHQYVMDENDEITGSKSKLLISSLPYSLAECCDMVRSNGGAAVPAHINKEANSVLANLGFIPPDIDFPVIEVWKGSPMPADMLKLKALYNSDAHNLAQISERENSIEADLNNRDEIIKKLSANRADV